MDGQYGHPVRIVAFNTAEGWSLDVTKDIADELRRRLVEYADVPRSVQAFVEAAIAQNFYDRQVQCPGCYGLARGRASGLGECLRPPMSSVRPMGTQRMTSQNRPQNNEGHPPRPDNSIEQCGMQRLAGSQSKPGRRVQILPFTPSKPLIAV